MVGPTSTAVGAAILQAIVCRVKELALAEGFAADFFQSSNMDGGDAWNARLLERYRHAFPAWPEEVCGLCARALAKPC